MASPLSLPRGYPLFADETCAFLAIDFDKAEWCTDVSAFLETCRRMQLPAALERSRSGRGGHVWLFFEEAIPAALARRLGSNLLTETWNTGRMSDWIPTTASFPARISCRKADSET